MLFLDYDVRTFQARNGNNLTYVLPYRAMVMVGDFRPDDTGGGSVYVVHNRRVQDSGDVNQYILSADTSGFSSDSSTCGSCVGLSGDTIVVDPVDDFDVKIFIFRLPEENA